MKFEVLYPGRLLLLLIVPILCFFCKKRATCPTIVMPSTFFLKKILQSGLKAPTGNFLLYLRLLAITFLIVGFAHPIFVWGTTVVDCNFYLICSSFLSFLVEIFLENTILLKVP